MSFKIKEISCALWHPLVLDWSMCSVCRVESVLKTCPIVENICAYADPTKVDIMLWMENGGQCFGTKSTRMALNFLPPPPEPGYRSGLRTVDPDSAALYIKRVVLEVEIHRSPKSSEKK
jgi:hypothetical protein